MKDSLLEQMSHRPAIELIDEGTVCVYLDLDGRPIPEAVAKRQPLKFVRVLVRSGHVPEGYWHFSKSTPASDEGDGFTRFFPSDPGLRRGVLIFAENEGRTISAEQTLPGAYVGRFVLDPEHFVEYLYVANTHHEHVTTYRVVQSWLNQ